MKKLLDTFKGINTNSITKNICDKMRQLLKKDCNIILFGAGVGGVNTLSFIKKNLLEQEYNIKCFVDNNPRKWYTVLDGVEILPCESVFKDYNGELIIISCGEGDEIISQLKDYKIPLERLYIPDVNTINENDPVYIRNHIKEYQYLYENLKDEKSRQVLETIVTYKITHNMDVISEIADSSASQYFDTEIITYKEDDIFLDCGAYIGDTVLQYLKNNKGIYESIICVEADPDNCDVIRKNILGMIRGKLYEVACWNKQTSVLFDKIGSGSGTLNVRKNSNNEKVQVKADTIDNLLNGERVSFIKMDIEGAEYKALLGAVDTIQRWHPTLMISAYHRQDDLIKLPALIHSMNEEYEFYLRHYRAKSIQETILYAVDNREKYTYD